MKIKTIFLAACLLAFGSVCFAQAKKKAEMHSSTPEQTVKNLYASHNADKSPFFQSTDRALVDRFFVKTLADLIWNDAVCQEKQGGICNLDFNVPYATNGGDHTDASAFKIGAAEYGEGNRQLADVPVTFKLFVTKENPGEAITILYRVEQEKNKTWKISDIFFPGIEDESGNSLVKLLSRPMDETPAIGDGQGNMIEGELQTGKTESVILYVGAETGDYAAYCFKNDSEAGRAILAACKNGDQCAVTGETDGAAACKVPGLEADLSASGRITKVVSAKKTGRK